MPASPAPSSFDIVIVGGTPGGVTAAIAAARLGASVLLLERTQHVGGLIASGLGATDIATRGATGGLFVEFVDRNHAYYVKTYGPDSEQVKVSSQGYHFEPAVAAQTLKDMLAGHSGKITLLCERQFDAHVYNVVVTNNRIRCVTVLNRQTQLAERYEGEVFIDATYEGDLAAAAGAGFSTRREGQKEYNEPLAGKVYMAWHGDIGEGTTGEGDDTLQAYNYRVCLTDRPDNRVPIAKPANYNRDEFLGLIDDIKLTRYAGNLGDEFALEGIGRVVNIVHLPNGKTDSNNQHLAFISTDLPEENYPWPTADWTWRDAFALRQRDYILGLLWFAQNEPELPAAFRAECAKWGLAKDEYQDNANFPRQVYVREGRRIDGEHLFTAHDALPVGPHDRPPIHIASVTSSHYALDSHAVHKREPNRVHLDGFISHATAPYTVPLGVIVPKGLDNVLTPVPVSGTHIGFNTLRMEPCWMALGQAAGIAAAQALRSGTAIKALDITALQKALIEQDAILIYYKDAHPSHPAFKALQYFGLRGAIPEWEARLDDPVTADDLTHFAKASGQTLPALQPGTLTRGALLQQLYAAIA